MYQYRVVPVGRLDTLARRYGGKHVTKVDDDASIDGAIQSALDVYAEEGWKLHSCHVFDKGRAMLIVERWDDRTVEKQHIEMG